MPLALPVGDIKPIGGGQLVLGTGQCGAVIDRATEGQVDREVGGAIRPNLQGWAAMVRHHKGLAGGFNLLEQLQGMALEMGFGDLLRPKGLRHEPRGSGWLRQGLLKKTEASIFDFGQGTGG